MLPWVLREPARLERERREIEALATTSGWLVGYEWLIADGLALDAIIRAHDHDYSLRVSFPQLYPDAPAVVRPLGADRRLSAHQYGGADGPLCLQWGPDNWNRDVSAAQLLESAHQLFEVENPLGADRPSIPVVAPSRHSLTIGQETRTRWARWYSSRGIREFLEGHPPSAEGSFQFSFRKLSDTWIVLVHSASAFDGADWTDTSLPTDLPSATPLDRYSGAWAKTDATADELRLATTLDALRALYRDEDNAALLATDGTSPVIGFQRAIAGVLLCDNEGLAHLFVVLSGSNVIYCAPIQSTKGDDAARAPSAALLRERKIGIVGLGSAGSKIALTLARMGTRKFFLVDHDIFLPENIQRNALDWQSVALHKVDAVKRAIGFIDPLSQVDVAQIHLSGQESNAVVNSVLTRLADCDVLVDATANPRVFNLVAAVSRAASRPMVWFEVFGGGTGGLIARSRPAADPTPQEMRAAYLYYCVANPAPQWMVAAADYSEGDSSNTVMTASDADVGVIAQHAARFVPDCLIPAAGSSFPHSMYLVGLARGWVFEEPFSTVPILTSRILSPLDRTPVSADISAETLAFLEALLEKAD